MICKECGFEFFEGVYCPECGSKFEDEIELIHEIIPGESSIEEEGSNVKETINKNYNYDNRDLVSTKSLQQYYRKENEVSKPVKSTSKNPAMLALVFTILGWLSFITIIGPICFGILSIIQAKNVLSNEKEKVSKRKMALGSIVSNSILLLALVALLCLTGYTQGTNSKSEVKSEENINTETVEAKEESSLDMISDETKLEQRTEEENDISKKKKDDEVNSDESKIASEDSEERYGFDDMICGYYEGIGEEDVMLNAKIVSKQGKYYLNLYGTMIMDGVAKTNRCEDLELHGDMENCHATDGITDLEVIFDNENTFYVYGNPYSGRYTRVTEEASKTTEYENNYSDISFWVEVNAPDGGVNMRSGPSTDFDIIEKMIPNGTNLIVTDMMTNENTGRDWYYTKYKGKDGWIAASQVEDIGGEYYDPLEDPDGYIIYDSANVLLTESNVGILSPQELTYARNEIYARHGYVFKSDELNRYFNSKNWYTPNPSFDGSLSAVEKANADFIKKYQENYGMKYDPK